MQQQIRYIMKKLLLILFLVLTSLTVNAQEKVMDSIDSLYNVGLGYLQNDRYPTALRNFNEALKLLENSEIEEKDQAFVNLKNMVGRCYYRMKQMDKAVETAREYVKHYAEKVSDNNDQYAAFMDNLSLYLLANKELEEALEWSEKSVKLYKAIEGAEDDYIVALTRHAEILSLLERKSDAVNTQMQALLMLKNLYGEHSNQYIAELQYQAKYYEDNGDIVRSEKTNDRVAKLEEEAEEGYVPAMIEFTEESTHKSIDDMRMCVKYFLYHRLGADNLEQAVEYIKGWSLSSDDVMINMGDAETEFMKEDKIGILFIAYIASCCEYALEKREKEFTPAMYRYGFIGMLNYYQRNKEILGKNIVVDEYIKLYDEEGIDKLSEKIDANFPKQEEEEENTK